MKLPVSDKAPSKPLSPKIPDVTGPPPKAKCPKCEKPFFQVVSEPIDVTTPFGKLQGIAYLCPHCSTAIAVGPDSTLLRDQIVRAIKRLLP